MGGSDSAKHIDLSEHFVHNIVKAGLLKLVPVAYVDNVADLLMTTITEHDEAKLILKPVPRCTPSIVCWKKIL